MRRLTGPEWAEAASLLLTSSAVVFLALCLFFCRKERSVAYDGCRVTGSMAVPSGTPTTAVFTGADFDTVPPYWLVGAGLPQTVQAQFAGKHRVQANASAGASPVAVVLLLNNQTVAPNVDGGWGDVLKLNPGDRLTLLLSQSSGNPLNVSYSLSVHFEGN